MRMHRHFKFVVWAALLALLAGCGGPKDSKPRAQASASSAAPDGVPGTATTVTPTVSAATGSKASPTSSPSPLSSPPSKGAPLAASAIRPAAPGDYLFDETGSSKVRGCFVSDTPQPTPTHLRIEPADGDRQQFVRDQTDEAGRGQVTTVVLQFRSDGVYLAFLRQESKGGAVNSVEEFEPSPPVLAAPASPTVGQFWAFDLTSKDGNIQVHTENKVEGVQQEVSLGDGSRVKADLIVSTSHATGHSTQGAADVSITSKTWFSRQLRIDVKGVTDSSGSAGLCQFESHDEALLRSSKTSTS